MEWRPTGRSVDGGVDRIPLPAVPGSLWLCGKHAVGPDPEAALQRVGATTVVCLSERHELADRYPSYVRWLESAGTDRALWYPVPDLDAPGLEDAATLLDDLAARLAGYFTGLSASDPADAEVLDLFGAGAFLPTEAANYDQIEEIGRDLGLVT